MVSMMRKMGVGGFIDPVVSLCVGSADLSVLSSEAAYELVKLIYAFPQVVKEAAAKYEPSVITRHIIDVAQGYNKFYHDEHILVEDAAERKAKLLLTAASMQTIRNGLALLGIKAPERM